MMADPANILLALAEIAATFAGFAALVTVFSRRRIEAAASHDLLRLRLVISSSIVVVLAALVPIALSGYGLEEEFSWRLAAGVFLLLVYLAILSFLNAYQNVRGHFPPDRLGVGVAAILEVLIQVALIIVVLGIFPDRHFGLYVSALIGTLAQAAFVFLRLVESTFTGIVEKKA